MPPQRTIPAVKAVKTERTHEENQERAYIAASRRSDRSLEARVESARRASEIHKRRTGRSLRVTEQDVVNEEMYEEEDDDLPFQYRRLTAHLQTGSADFNRRLAAYLTNHVAMRSALDQAINSSYAQQFPNAPQFAHNNGNTPSSPAMGQPMPPNMQPNGMQPYQQSPYPMSGAPGYRPQVHGRSASISVPHDAAQFKTPHSATASPVPGAHASDIRRMSMPASTSPVGARTPQPRSTPQMYPMIKQEMGQPKQSVQQALQQAQQQTDLPYRPNEYNDISPLSMSLPSESQLMLGSALDPSDPFTSALMAGSEQMTQPFQSSFYYPPSKQSANQYDQSAYGPAAGTLAPSVLDLPDPYNQTDRSSHSTDSVPTPSFGGDGTDGLFGSGDALKAAHLTRSNSMQMGGDGRLTPSLDSEWNAFIEGNTWEENGT
ncbi:MAG: hypothetical protein M1819_000583 [Sarea resinae]|nr:MAG: hypothetical protein M1819_000583 [Sarea resinae]